MSVAITVLGSSGSYASATNPCTGFLVRTVGYSLLLDCGPGTLVELQKHIPLESLDAIVLTHCHPDHWLELPVIRNALRYYLDRRGVVVYGTAETHEMADALWGPSGAAPTFDRHTLSDGSEWQIGPFRMRCSRTEHPPETLAVRLDSAAGSLAFSSDTGAAWTFAELGRGIDLAIGEATVLDADVAAVAGVHSSARQAGEGASGAGVGRLLLTHLHPGGDVDKFGAEASEAYGSPVPIALPGATFHL